MEQGIALVVDGIYRLGLQVGLLLMVVAAADYWWQRREFETSIRMSKEEIKEEFKQMEGDPWSAPGSASASGRSPPKG